MLHPVLQSDYLNFAIVRNSRRAISDEVDRPVRLRRIDRHDGNVPNVAAGAERPDICQNSLYRRDTVVFSTCVYPSEEGEAQHECLRYIRVFPTFAHRD
jgi:hypothetical protein